MGFEEPVRHIRLVFDDPAYAGASVLCNGEAELGFYFELGRLAEAGTADGTEQALRKFGDGVLVEWNLAKGGEALPPTSEGLMRLSPKFASLLMTSWLKAVAEVPAPLDNASGNGVKPPAGSIPMAVLSGSPGS